MHDVVVIGGNIAGATAAINAAEFGVKVALIEKYNKPLYPPRCGEATDEITAEILKLDEMKCPKNKIKQITINISSKKEYNFNIKKHGIYIIDRHFLEKKLLKNAEQKNVAMKIGRRMTDFNPPNEIILDNSEKIYGKIIIDATGISCQVGKKIGINTSIKPNDIGICIQSRVEGNFNSNIMKMWYHKPYAPFGYAWFFPKSNKKANIGIGIPGGQKQDLPKLLKKYIKKETGEKVKVLHTFRSCVPASKPLEQISKDNVLIVGDAARFANPIFENGINNAIFSASVAGTVAAKYINGDISTLNVYNDAMKDKIKKMNKAYKNKNKLTTEKKYINAYRRGFSTIHIINKLFPNLLQNQLIKIVKNDKKIIDNIKNN